MQLSGRAALLSVAFKTVDVTIEGSGTYRIRELTGADRDKFEVGAFNDETDIVDGKPVFRRKLNQLHLRARLVALCLIDGDTGKRMFADDEVEQLSEGVPTVVLGKLFTAAQKLNGLDGTATEEAEKNSEADQSDASTSD
jgi:hypothetical protein